MSVRLSASKTSQALACQWWLKDSVELAPDAPGPAAERGTAIHAWAENHVNGAVPIVPDEERWLWDNLRTWLDGLKASVPRLETEQAFVYSTATSTARHVETFGPRDYGMVQAGDIPGSVDLLAHGPTLQVIDIKTGKRKNTERASENKQLRTLGLSAARYFGVDNVRVGLAFVEEDGVTEDWHELDDLDLDVHGARLKTVVDGIPNSVPVEGRHCRYCLARGSCPAKQ